MCLCFNWAEPGCWFELGDGDGAEGAGYDGGEENRCGEVVFTLEGVSGASNGVAGKRDEV